MDNYNFCATWAQRIGGRVLDYGCGAGEVVGLLRSRGVDAFGCDVFYEGGHSNVPDALGPFVAQMAGDAIPFPDAYFDAVISNQVLEHVPDIDAVAREIARVLKPNGVALHLFPGQHVLIEPHVKVPLLHWFPKGAAWRLPWTMAMRALRYGRAARPLREVSQTRIAWVDSWTHYRTASEISRVFRQHFAGVEHVEHEVVNAHARLPVPNALKRIAWRALAGSALLVRGH